MSDSNKDEIFHAGQTSAKMMIQFAQKRIETLRSQADSTKLESEEQRFVILYDLFIKTNSYTILNKVFFWMSVFAAIAVLLWPSFSVILPSEDHQWLKSAIVQTTVTGIAALSFAFYSQYKDKQTYGENLMRYVLFSRQDVAAVSEKVIEEIAKIDKGFSFAHLINKQDQQ